MNGSKEWMYQRLNAEGFINPEFASGVESFLRYAIVQPSYMQEHKILCPCRKCKNMKYDIPDNVHYHLLKEGFVSHYEEWWKHGEKYVYRLSPSSSYLSMSQHQPMVEPLSQQTSKVNEIRHPEHTHDITEMVRDSGSNVMMDDDMEDEPNAEAKKFFDLLKDCKSELYPGCRWSKLEVVARMLNVKAEFHSSDEHYDAVAHMVKDFLPSDNIMVEDFNGTKKLLKELGLPVETIDCCPTGCMIYWRDDKILTECKVCRQERYKPVLGCARRRKRIPYKRMYYFPLVPRLQRLYYSKATAHHMRWHAEHTQEGDKMSHPSDSESWKHFNDTWPEFASEIRNVRLGLCIDKFQPFSQSGQQYSSWPIMLTPYNLPPGMCMKKNYIFLTIIIPGPSFPKQNLDVYMQPLIAELQMLWSTGVETYDVFKKDNFNMRAALIWTISKFSTISMLSGWTTVGKVACPYCMERGDTNYLSNGEKTCWFDCHRKFLPPNHHFRNNRKDFRKNVVVKGLPPATRSGDEILDLINRYGLVKVTDDDASLINGNGIGGWKKKSIFWDLPYWSSLLVRHNLDVMHIEKNVFDNIFSTIMGIEGKTKDTKKSREDIKMLCNRPELLQTDSRTGKFPKACYTVSKAERKIICEWLNGVTFPDGYVSNLSRLIDMEKYKMYGLKSHDCHVFMQRLLPIAFREFLPDHVWYAITELSIFFKMLTTTSISVADMRRLELDIPVVICKLERIFPPSLFNSMEHLPIHLPYEARIAGPVQYRWMYPFERYLRRLKNNVRNTARVEGSIRNAYLVEEVVNFCSHYFDETVMTRHRRLPHNWDGGPRPEVDGSLSIFTYPGRSHGRVKKRYLQSREYQEAHTYVLLNCPELKTYIRKFIRGLKAANRRITKAEVDKNLDDNFAGWFKNYGQNNHIENRCVYHVSQGPILLCRTFNTYFCNGYKFQTMSDNAESATVNSGVCVKGSNYSSDAEDYYGRLIEIIELEYPTTPIKRTVLFSCDWFDPTVNVGMKYEVGYNLVDLHSRKKLRKYEPFIFANQATQVCYLSYPSNNRRGADWLNVCKIKPRSVIDAPDLADFLEYEALQEDQDATQVSFVNPPDDHVGPLNDPHADMIDLDEQGDIDSEHEDDFELSDTYSTDENLDRDDYVSDNDME